MLGGGTGGTLTANRLRRHLGDEVEIHVIDQDDRHVYQPALLFVPFGLAKPRDIVRSRKKQLLPRIQFHETGIDYVSLESDMVYLSDGHALGYDVLVVASGAVLQPEETEGLTGPGWGERAFTFYDLAGASALAGAMERFEGGRLVVNVVDMPIKCPIAPLEFSFLADWYLHQRGIRKASEITFVTPLDGAFTKPVASAHLGDLLEQKGDPHRDRVRGGRGGRRGEHPALVRRPRDPVRPARDRSTARRRARTWRARTAWATRSASCRPTPGRSRRG